MLIDNVSDNHDFCVVRSRQSSTWIALPEVKRFFEDYKALENKVVVVEDFLDRAEALESITQAIARYRQHRLHEGGAA
jgi:inorganic pyrophosphatase